jgi:hypothetical protein
LRAQPDYLYGSNDAIYANQVNTVATNGQSKRPSRCGKLSGAVNVGPLIGPTRAWTLGPGARAVALRVWSALVIADAIV